MIAKFKNALGSGNQTVAVAADFILSMNEYRDGYFKNAKTVVCVAIPDKTSEVSHFYISEELDEAILIWESALKGYKESIKL